MNEPEHSPLGASSAERWMNCVGSTALLARLQLPPTDAPDYRQNGVAAHAVAAHCLLQGCDAWETVGETFETVTVDQNMADAVQVYLDTVRPHMTETATVMIEERIGKDHIRRPHPQFYGTVDFAAYDTERLTVVDYKHGEGIVVDVEWNPQIMYYAYGILLTRPNVREDREVLLKIVQPRAFHPDGPVREWATTAGEIINWAETQLIPAMEVAGMENSFKTGDWCRFCPAKLICPALVGIFGAAAKADMSMVPNLSNERLGLEWQQIAAVNHYVKALKDETQRRMLQAIDIPDLKLVYQKANRVWKDGAVDLATKQFGEEAFTKPEIKSPAKLAELGEDAKKFVAEWAFTPKTGLTVALASDKKPAVKVEKAVDTFAAFAQSAGESGGSSAASEAQTG